MAAPNPDFVRKPPLTVKELRDLLSTNDPFETLKNHAQEIFASIEIYLHSNNVHSLKGKPYGVLKNSFNKFLNEAKESFRQGCVVVPQAYTVIVSHSQMTYMGTKGMLPCVACFIRSKEKTSLGHCDDDSLNENDRGKEAQYAEQIINKIGDSKENIKVTLLYNEQGGHVLANKLETALGGKVGLIEKKVGNFDGGFIVLPTGEVFGLPETDLLIEVINKGQIKDTLNLPAEAELYHVDNMGFLHPQNVKENYELDQKNMLIPKNLVLQQQIEEGYESESDGPNFHEDEEMKQQRELSALIAGFHELQRTTEADPSLQSKVQQYNQGIGSSTPLREQGKPDEVEPTTGKPSNNDGSSNNKFK